jgi:hypothetical protein
VCWRLHWFIVLSRNGVFWTQSGFFSLIWLSCLLKFRDMWCVFHCVMVFDIGLAWRLQYNWLLYTRRAVHDLLMQPLCWVRILPWFLLCLSQLNKVHCCWCALYVIWIAFQDVVLLSYWESVTNTFMEIMSTGQVYGLICEVINTYLISVWTLMDSCTCSLLICWTCYNMILFSAIMCSDSVYDWSLFHPSWRQSSVVLAIYWSCHSSCLCNFVKLQNCLLSVCKSPVHHA